MAATADMTSHVILVDEDDNELGQAEKLEAHRQALLHRAFSIFIFRSVNNELELLLQQRAAHKYHSPNLWTNTVCSHPHPGEAVKAGASRRLREELGLNLPLEHAGKFMYTAHFDNGLTEKELDHVFVGWDQSHPIVPNPEEVQAIRWITIPQLRAELKAEPHQFTPWLAEALLLALCH